MTSMPAFTGTAALVVRRTVTAVVFLIAGLAFTFGFGNGWALGVRLGVPAWIAPLVAPAVDLSVVALLAAVQYLRAQGTPGRLAGPRLLLALCGLITFALNIAQPVLVHQWGRACFDAVAPLLLIGWSEVGPRLLALLHGTVPAGPAAPAVLVVPDGRPAVPDRPQDEDSTGDEGPTSGPGRAEPPADLVDAARQVASDHHDATGRAITRDALRARLRVSNAVASDLLRHLRAGSSA